MYTSTFISSLVVLGAHSTYALPRPTDNVHQIDHRDSTSLPSGISAEEALDAFPPRDVANITNWFGTSLYGWDGCDAWDPAFKTWIKEAYTDANRLSNQDGVKSDIEWDSSAAFEFLGPSALNKVQQPQIQAVLSNMATVYEGSALWTPNWIRARCDDPLKRCSLECPQPGQPRPSDLLAYARNPGNAGNTDDYPDINFCLSFFARRTLDQAMQYGSSSSRLDVKYDLANYESRGSALLHELFHLDLAADSVNESPNPHVRDLRIRFKLQNGKKSGYVTAYGAKLAKTIAKFVPSGPESLTTGYFVQRNADSFAMFTLAKYVQTALGSYPFLPAVYDEVADAPVLPPVRTSINSIAYSTNGTNDVSFDISDGNIPGSTDFLSVDGNCPIIETSDEGITVDLEIGGPVDPTMIPVAYANDRYNFLASLVGTNNSSPAAASCSVEVQEVWTCEDPATNLYALVTVKDTNGVPYYSSPMSVTSPGQPINNASPLTIQNDTMAYSMTITGEHQNDYIQFEYGSLAWQSSTTNGTATCMLNGNDWNPNGPQGCPTEALTRSFTCQYPCDGSSS